jgi:hypothetical protein
MLNLKTCCGDFRVLKSENLFPKTKFHFIFRKRDKRVFSEDGQSLFDYFRSAIYETTNGEDGDGVK